MRKMTAVKNPHFPPSLQEYKAVGSGGHGANGLDVAGTDERQGNSFAWAQCALLAMAGRGLKIFRRDIALPRSKGLRL